MLDCTPILDPASAIRVMRAEQCEWEQWMLWAEAVIAAVILMAALSFAWYLASRLRGLRADTKSSPYAGGDVNDGTGIEHTFLRPGQ